MTRRTFICLDYSRAVVQEPPPIVLVDGKRLPLLVVLKPVPRAYNDKQQFARRGERRPTVGAFLTVGLGILCSERGVECSVPLRKM